MKCSIVGQDLIRKWEGVRLQSYQDSAGVWTVGWGHTRGVGNYPHSISQLTAEMFFREDVEEAEITVLQQLGDWVPTQLQFDALVSFTFNLGPRQNSTLFKLLRLGQARAAANEFTKWVFAGDKMLPGLVSRRQEEKQTFLRGCV